MGNVTGPFIEGSAEGGMSVSGKNQICRLELKFSHAGDSLAGDCSGYVFGPGEGDWVWKAGLEWGDGSSGYGKQTGGGEGRVWGQDKPVRVRG